MKLQLEINSRAINDDSRALLGHGIMCTPFNLDEDFWLLRVAVSDKQAVVGFPKFGLIGVGFQVETNWNLNRPCGGHKPLSAEYIYEHIAENKGDDAIPAERCIQAIQILIDAVTATAESKTNKSAHRISRS